MLNLNQEQQKAISHNTGPMMVLSGPGSGKTTVISLRIKNLIEVYSVNPNNILVVTFTKNSAEEMKQRFYSLVDYKYKGVDFGTFHSHFFKIIRDHNNYTLNDVVHEKEKIDLLKEIIKKAQKNPSSKLNEMSQVIFDSDDDFYTTLSSEISFVKNILLNPKEFDSSVTNSFFEMYKEYESLKNHYKKIDFDDMLIKCYELLKNDTSLRNRLQNKFKYILIDEFQDINKVQYECIKLLLDNNKNLFVVGDDDQSIYAFRGSDPDILLNFPIDFPEIKKTVLNINYRSTEDIINISNIIINDNKKRFDKNLVGTGKVSDKKPNLLTTQNIYAEAKEIVKKIKIIKDDNNNSSNNFNVAIIYRTNFQATSIIENLVQANISYQSNDYVATIYDHHIAQDILAYLEFAENNFDNQSFMRIANKPKRYLSKNLLIDAIKCVPDGNCILNYLYSCNNLESWQLTRIHDFKFDIQQLKNKLPYDAIKYILYNIGYDKYLEDFANYKKTDYKSLVLVSEQILESSKNFETISEYLKHIKNISDEINKLNKKTITKSNLEPNSDFIVTLTTMHSSKGLEFDIVFIISCVEGIIPHEKSYGINDLEEERRLLYVAITRAKLQLTICIVREIQGSYVKHSQFLNNII